jgi:GTPase
VLFVNSTRLFEPTYQRYLLNVFREKLPFHDIPIKLYMRSRRPAEGTARSSANGPEIEPGTLSPGSAEPLEEHAVHAHKGAPFDVASRFLNREVNELLADLDK